MVDRTILRCLTAIHPLAIGNPPNSSHSWASSKLNTTWTPSLLQFRNLHHTFPIFSPKLSSHSCHCGTGRPLHRHLKLLHKRCMVACFHASSVVAVEQGVEVWQVGKTFVRNYHISHTTKIWCIFSCTVSTFTHLIYIYINIYIYI